MRAKSKFEDALWFAGLGCVASFGSPLLFVPSWYFVGEVAATLVLLAVGVALGWYFNGLSDFSGIRSWRSHLKRAWIAYLVVAFLVGVLLPPARGLWSPAGGEIFWPLLSPLVPIGGLILGDLVTLVHAAAGGQRAPSN